MNRHAISVMAVLVSLGACASGAPSTVELAPAARPPESRTTQATERDRAGGPGSSAPQSQPLASRERTSLSLAQAIERARRHPLLLAAQAAVAEAEAYSRAAGRWPDPSLVARMESAPIQGGTTSQAEYVLGVSQPLPLGGRLPAARTVAELERDRALRRYAAARFETERHVRGAFATALHLEQVGQLLAETVALRQREMELARTRVRAGDAAGSELLRTEMEHIQARLELDRAHALSERAHADLAAAVGDDTLRVAVLVGSVEEVFALPDLELLVMRLENHPLLAIAASDIVVEQARAELASAERIPQVNLDLFYRRLQHSARDAFDVGLSFALPLSGVAEERRKAAQAGAQAAVARARATRQELLRDARDAHTRLSAALGVVRTLRDELLPRSQRVLGAMEARYRSGDVSLAELLPLRREHGALQLTRLDGLREVMTAWQEIAALLAL